jgi:hypothetical protein
MFRRFALLLLSLSFIFITRQATKAQSSNDPWWKHAVIYEIYPRSFQDSNGDGIGDLNGVTSRLDYLKDLGIDAIWITPFFPSPQVDFGYDVADYTAVDPQFGTMADFDRLVGEATHGSRSRDLPATIPSVTGMSGETEKGPTSLRTTGSHGSDIRPGN